MSRSYKKHLWIKCGCGSKSKTFFKNYANRTVRRKSVNFEIADGGSYRKFFDQYTICDCKLSYDPEPRIYFFNGNPKIITGDPLWKYRRK
jgi:hypothetical protein